MALRPGQGYIRPNYAGGGLAPGAGLSGAQGLPSANAPGAGRNQVRNQPFRPVRPAGVAASAIWRGPHSPGAGYTGVGGGWWVPSATAGGGGGGKGAGAGGGGSAAGGGGQTGRWANPLYQPLQTPSGRDLFRMAQALTNVEYDPLINQYRQQLAQNALHTKAVQDETTRAYNAFLPYVQQSAQDVQNAYQTGGQQLANIGQNTQNQLTAIGQASAADPLLQSREAEGLGGGAAGTLAAALASAKALEANQQQAQQTYASNVGAAQTALAGKQPGIYATTAGQNVAKEGQAGLLAAQPIQQSLATTRSTKASKLASNLMAARQQAFTNYITGQNLLTGQQKADAAAKQAAWEQNPNAPGSPANARVQAGKNAVANAGLSAGRLDLATRQAAFNEDPTRVGSPAWARVQAANKAAKTAAGRRASGGSGAMTTTENNTYWKNITRIQARLRWLYKYIGGLPGATQSGTYKQAWQALHDGRIWVPPDPGAKNQNDKTKWHWVGIANEGDTGLLNVAYNSTNGFGLTAGDVNYLHDRGFTIGSLMPLASSTAAQRAAGKQIANAFNTQ